ncbi:DMT family transporter [Nitrospirillum sp. BR 11164]|uniref:DMT family transporter n=1 Tax=Nitrospirillum sp. BR 11164 TaxID=3104324 RepID=UPI002AFE80BA|nr:DMT family transporter [Nitrospirillum sp. BR 11164]MEA1647981.1 DMT family transporter [Nitrospirillum sp. BR 11164]
MAVPAYRRPWLLFALLTTGLWGVWGAFAGAPAENGFPETLIYVVWAFTMIPPALYALWRVGWSWPWDRRSMMYGAAVGLLGAGGQMILFHAVRIGPTYLIFPVIALSPLVTIVLSATLLRERVTWVGGLGILCALVALPLFDFSPGGAGGGQGLAWFVLALLVLVAWGVQGFFMKYAAPVMSAEAIFAYMALTGLLLAPAALAMTDFSQPINYGWSGPGLAAATQILNSIGALTLVYAFRHGRAIVVSPLANAGAPLITALISLAALGLVPAVPKLAGIGLAFAAAALLTIEPEDQA